YVFLFVFAEIVELLAGLGVVNDRTGGNGQDGVVRALAGAVRAFAGTSYRGFVFGVESKMEQRIVVRVRPQDDVAALAAVAARGAAPWDVLLPPERTAAVAALAGQDPDADFIDKHGGRQ